MGHATSELPEYSDEQLPSYTKVVDEFYASDKRGMESRAQQEQGTKDCTLWQKLGR